uniref:EGF-like domain-containing protein n=1 Tax=Strongyloides venezuelensis TaxID=75913 RepID=A0A0K0FQT5_STRVS
MKHLELLFFVIFLYFLITNDNVLSKKCKKKKPSKTTKPPIDTFVMNTSFEFIFSDNLKDKKNQLKYFVDLMGRETCFNFIESPVSSIHTATLFKMDTECMAVATLNDKYITHSIHLNSSCMGRDKVLKLMYFSMELRYEFSKCVGKHQGQINEVNMAYVLKNYKCHFYHRLNGYMDFDLEPFIVTATFKRKKSTNITEPSALEQRNHAADFSFNDLKRLNSKVCGEECEDHPCGTCDNYGFRNVKNCDFCICPFFFTGGNCENLEKPKKPDDCGPQDITATKNEITRTLDINAECYYNIKPEKSSKRVRVKFIPIGDSIHWPCSSSKLLEVKYEKDRSKDGIMPCGKMKEFNVTASKGVSVLVYHDKIAHSFKMKMEIKAF